MTDRRIPEIQSGRITRTSAACLACRTRKQKCSGERPECAQCRINEAQCDWPPQQKRGPPKQYTTALEIRLFETENILLALISQASSQQLQASFRQLQELKHLKFGLPPDISDAEVLNYTRKHKSGPSYWDAYPLNSAEDLKCWWINRTPGARGPLPGLRAPDLIGSRTDGFGSPGFGDDASTAEEVRESREARLASPGVRDRYLGRGPDDENMDAGSHDRTWGLPEAIEHDGGNQGAGSAPHLAVDSASSTTLMQNSRADTRQGSTQTGLPLPAELENAYIW